MQFNKTLERKSWETLNNLKTAAVAVADTSANPPAEFSSRSAGVGGLIRKREKELTAVGSMAEAALTDLDALMKREGDVVDVV